MIEKIPSTRYKPKSIDDCIMYHIVTIYDSLAIVEETYEFDKGGYLCVWYGKKEIAEMYVEIMEV